MKVTVSNILLHFWLSAMEPVVEIWGFRKEKSIFWQMRAI
jgi:hypothetical protein